jgi:hypothetical protein
MPSSGITVSVPVEIRIVMPSSGKRLRTAATASLATCSIGARRAPSRPPSWKTSVLPSASAPRSVSLAKAWEEPRESRSNSSSAHPASACWQRSLPRARRAAFERRGLSRPCPFPGSDPLPARTER